MTIEPDIAVDVSADVIRSLLQANFERLPLHQMAVQVLVASNLDLRLRVAEILDVDIGDATTTASGALEAAVSVSVRAEI